MRGMVFSMLSLVTAAFVGCAEDVSEPSIKGEQAQVKVIPTFHSPSKRGTTRAVDGLNINATGFSCLYDASASDEQSPDSKAKVMIDDGGDVDYISYAYRVTGSSALAVEGDAPTFPSDVDAVNVYGWYPYTADHSFTIQADQRTTTDYCLSDLMFANKAQCTRDANGVTPAPLAFRHVMSKVKIVLNPDEGVTVKSVKLMNVKPTVTIDDTDKGNLEVSAAEGEAGDVILLSGGSITSASAAADKTLAAVFPAQTIDAAFIQITADINGSPSTITYVCGTPRTFAKGNEYVANIPVLTSYTGDPTIDIDDMDNPITPLVDNRNYLTLESQDADGTITVQIRSDIKEAEAKTFQYSIDDGATWNDCKAYKGSNYNIPAAHKVMFRGNNASYTKINHIGYSNTEIRISDGSAYVYGNVMSLIDAENFETLTAISEDYALAQLFYGNTSIDLDPEKELLLPATTLADACYQQMFIGCTSLTTAPELPATTLANGCYASMFSGCTSLTTAPELPATTLANGCYASMFSGCTSLTSAPALPATTLAYSCYYNMFDGCTSLTTAPELPATTLANGCYQWMFIGCTSLTTAPALPATTLADGCYQLMFDGCTSLTTAPELPATTLANDCYASMFKGCSKLSSVTCLYTGSLSWTGTYRNYTEDWLENAGTSATSPTLHVKAGQSTDPIDWDLPTGWTVIAALLTNDQP